MLHKVWNSKGEMPYCFPRSSIKFQGHTVQNITDFDPNWAFPDYRPVAAFKSLRFALFLHVTGSKFFLQNLADTCTPLSMKAVVWGLGNRSRRPIQLYRHIPSVSLSEILPVCSFIPRSPSWFTSINNTSLACMVYFRCSLMHFGIDWNKSQMIFTLTQHRHCTRNQHLHCFNWDTNTSLRFFNLRYGNTNPVMRLSSL